VWVGGGGWVGKETWTGREEDFDRERQRESLVCVLGGARQVCVLGGSERAVRASRGGERRPRLAARCAAARAGARRARDVGSAADVGVV